MGQTPETIILQIGDPDKDSDRYPLRLFLAEKKAPKELAQEWITKDRLDRTKLPFPDPVTTFLEETEESDEFLTIGQYLYDLLHQNTIATHWDELKAKHDRLRVELEIIPSEVAAFPWELLSDGFDRLVVDLNSILTRKFTLGKAKKTSGKIKKTPNLDSGPLRVLIVIGAKDYDEDVLPLSEVRKVETEIRKGDRQQADNLLAHRMIDIKVVPRPTIQKLQSEYEDFKPHIFHFIGHGKLIGKQGCLIINAWDKATEAYDEIEWRADRIKTNFQAWGWLPRLVFINACRSDAKGTPTEDVRQQAWSIGDIFRQLEVPAVLSMQADINGNLAGIFAGTLYKSLAEFKPLDEAVSRARAQLVTEESLDSREWAIPVLTIAIPPEDVFRIKPTPAERLVEIKNCAIFKDIDLFSDCAEARRKLIRGFYPPPPQTDKDLIIVKGNDETGKSWLARWCMEVCSLLNHDIRYVEIGGNESRTWLDVLQQIRDGDDTKQNSLLIHQPLRADAFYRFNWELEHRFRGEVPPSVFDNSKWPAKKIKLADSAKWTPNFEVETFQSFQQAIVQAAEINNPLIIVLDHFTKGPGIMERDMIDLFIPNLVVPAARQKFREKISTTKMRSVKFVLVLTEKEIKTFKFDELVSDYHLVPLAPFQLAEAREMLLEYLRYSQPNRAEEQREGYVKFLLEVYAAPEWTPKALINLLPR